VISLEYISEAKISGLVYISRDAGTLLEWFIQSTSLEDKNSGLVAHPELIHPKYMPGVKTLDMCTSPEMLEHSCSVSS
jgi:hypothetical protein